LSTKASLLDSIGVRRGWRGWRCLEVGAGGGSIAAWLCDRVAPEGDVVATDMDTTVLRERSRPHLEIRVHDALEDALPDGAFDVVHLPAAGVAERAADGAAPPGGGAQSREAGCWPRRRTSRRWPPIRGLTPASAAPSRAGRRRTMPPSPGDTGSICTTGAGVTGDLATPGRPTSPGEGRVSMWRGGEAGGTVWRLTLTRLRDPMVASGLVTLADVDAVIALCHDSAFAFVSPIVMAARGRRPVSA
jgi:methyltransferase family protein